MKMDLLRTFITEGFESSWSLHTARNSIVDLVQHEAQRAVKRYDPTNEINLLLLPPGTILRTTHKHTQGQGSTHNWMVTGRRIQGIAPVYLLVQEEGDFKYNSELALRSNWKLEPKNPFATIFQAQEIMYACGGPTLPSSHYNFTVVDEMKGSGFSGGKRVKNNHVLLRPSSVFSS